MSLESISSWFQGHLESNHYVGPTCNKPRDEFIPRVDVVKGQMGIMQSPEPDCAIWLGRVIDDIYQDSNAIVYSYKVEVQLWNPTGASEDLDVFYIKCLIENNNGLLVQKKYDH